jgi:hypothetical protein
MKDYSEQWLELTIQTRMMHNWCLIKKYDEAAKCAAKAKEISIQLEKTYKELQNGNPI